MAVLVADPDTRVIDIVTAPTDGFLTVDMQTDIYSRLKDDWISDPILKKLKFPFRSFGDPKNASNQIGPYVFFNNLNGWRLRAYDADHELTLLGNLVGESAVQGLSVPVWVPRPGRQILVLSEQSAQALGTELSQAEMLDLARTMWMMPIRASVPAPNTTARSTAEGGFQNGAVWLDALDGDDNNIGAVTQPVKTFSEAANVSVLWGLKRIRVVSPIDVVLAQGLVSYEIITDSSLGESSLDFNGQPVSTSHFENLGLTGSIVDAVAPIGSVIHYKMNETTGTNVPDTSGGSNDGTTVNMDDTNWVPGKINNGLSFDGLTEYVDCGTTVAAFEKEQPFSVEFWVEVATPIGPPRVVVSRILGQQGWRTTVLPNGAVQWFIGSSITDTLIVAQDTADPGFISLADSVFHHVVCTYDGGLVTAGMQIWVDGIQQALIFSPSGEPLDGSIVPATSLFLGKENGLFFAGKLDEVLVYNKKLNSTEIEARYNSGSGTEGSGIASFTFSASGSTFKSPMSGIGGTFRNCGFICNPGEVFNIRPNKTNLKDCYSKTPDVGSYVPPRFDFSGVNLDAVFRNWSGSLEALNINDAGSRIEIEASSGTVTLDASCTLGTIVIRGGCDLVDNSTGTTVIDQRTVLSAASSSYEDGSVWVSQANGDDANDGTVIRPVKTLPRAKQVAIANSLRMLKFSSNGSFVLSEDYSAFQFFNSIVGSKFIDLNGQDLFSSDFKEMVLTGAVGGAFANISASKCLFFNTVTNLAGGFYECSFLQQIPGQFAQLAGGTATALIDCSAANTSFDNVYNPPKFRVSGTDIDVSFRRWSGPMWVDGMDDANASVEIDCTGAHVTILNTCVAGTIRVRGTASLDDQSGVGCTVINETTQSEVWEEPDTHLTLSTIGRFVLKELLTFKKFIGGS